MSRRYSDQPINLIARIPSPEQMSAARPKQRSFIQLVMESGATCARGIADMVAQIHRLGRSLGAPMKDRQAGSVSLDPSDGPVVAKPQSATAYLSDDRLARWNALLDATVPHIESAERTPESIPVQAVPPAAAAIKSAPLDEVVALRLELLAHQQEVARLSVQLQELKSLVGSQQQALVYLGQELEAQQLPIAIAAAQAAPSAKKARVMRAKSAGKELSASRKVSREPSLNL